MTTRRDRLTDRLTMADTDADVVVWVHFEVRASSRPIVVRFNSPREYALQACHDFTDVAAQLLPDHPADALAFVRFARAPPDDDDDDPWFAYTPPPPTTTTALADACTDADAVDSSTPVT